MKTDEVFRRIVGIGHSLIGLMFFKGQKYDLICALGAVRTRLNLLIEYLEQFQNEKDIDLSKFN